MPQTEAQLLQDLQAADNPTDYLSSLFDSIDYKDDMRLRRFLQTLSNRGYINIPLWADNKPYYVELLEPDGVFEHQPAAININDDHSIVIGDGVSISRSSIGIHQDTKSIQRETRHKSLFEKHPVVCSLIISFIVGFVFLFSFWKDIVNAIEGLF